MIDNHLTERWYNGLTRPELWHMNAKNGAILISFTEKGYEILETMLEKMEGAAHMRPSLSQSWGIEGVFPSVTKKNDYTLCINIKLQKNDTQRKLVCRSLSSLFDILNYVVSGEAEEKRNPYPKEQVQLFSMNTFYSQTATYHGAGMEVSISPESAKFLIEHSEQSIPGVYEAMKTHHLTKYPKDRRTNFGGFFGGLSGVIREKGTLSFATCGNCACLGHMPIEIQEGQGLYIDSHNLDTSWQQLSMVIGVATTWKWVRDSLGYT